MKKTIYMDDIDEDVEADAGTVIFGLEGTMYEIDLSKKNATKLRSVLGPFIAAARVTRGVIGAPEKPAKTKATGNTNPASPLASGYNSDQLKAIREWAVRNGHEISPRGRVPKDVIAEFEKNGGLKSITVSATPEFVSATG